MMKKIDVAAAVIVHEGKVLLARRTGGHLHNLWEFPGGKIEGNETPAQAAERELLEELDIRIHAGETLLIHDHDYIDKSVRLYFVKCSLTSNYTSCFQKTQSNKLAEWFAPKDFPFEEFCGADKIAAQNLPWEKILSVRK
ncbi:MAG: hypothetical protein Kow0029_05720 [Candidatus Rifleibacteriota bacterium]